MDASWDLGWQRGLRGGLDPNPFDHVPLALKHLRPCQTSREFVEAGTSRDTLASDLA